jgi:hypothetical protein
MILNRSFSGQVVNAGFSYIAPIADTTPNPIADQTIENVALLAEREFTAFQVTGIDTTVTASIINGEMSVSPDGINYGAYSSVNQPIDNNYWIQVNAIGSDVNETTIVAALSVGGVSASFSLITVNGVGVIVVPTTYLAAKSQITVTKAKRNIIYHDGSSVPTADPKDPNSNVWYGLELLGFSDDETILTGVVLIDGEVMTVGQENNGLRFEELQSNGVNLAKIRLTGGDVDKTYRVTLRYSTQYVPSDDRSQDITIKEL